jgi:thiol-disulfide isomerase/thioredoxin
MMRAGPVTAGRGIAGRLAAAALALALGACSGSPASTASPSRSTTASGPATAGAPAKTVQLNAPGAPVDVAAALPAGYVTVVDFWSASCEPCKTFGEMLDAGVADEPRVVIRKVDVGDGFTQVAQTYNIATLPHFFIYDKRKRLRYDLIGPDCKDAASYAKQLAVE